MIWSERSADVLLLTLDRPERANSLTAAMLAELIAQVGTATGLRLLILTGAGNRVFSAGADLAEARAGLATSPLWEELSAAVAALPCLTVAALNGTLAGGAFGMALACDIRLAVPAASFFYPVAELGFLPQPSDPARLAVLVGPARANLVLAGGARLDASEALTFGLIDRIVPDPVAAARALAPGAAAHIAAIKAMVPTPKSRAATAADSPAPLKGPPDRAATSVEPSGSLPSRSDAGAGTDRQPSPWHDPPSRSASHHRAKPARRRALRQAAPSARRPHARRGSEAEPEPALRAAGR